MPKLPIVSGKQLVKILQSHGLELIRQKGSHFRFRFSEGRATTVPVHGNKDLPRGLTRKILLDDLELTEQEAKNWLES